MALLNFHPSRRSIIAPGAVIRLPDNTPEQNDLDKHKHIVLAFDGPFVVSVPLCTLDLRLRPSCIILPEEAPRGLIRHPSYVKFIEYRSGHKEALDRDIQRGRCSVSMNCGEELLAKIIAAATSDDKAPTRLRERLGAPRRPRRLT